MASKKRQIPKTAKIDKKYTDNDVKRYLGALMEEMRDYKKASAEHSAIIEEKLDSHAEAIGDLKVKITGVETRLDGVETRLNKIESGLDKVWQRLDAVDSDMCTVKRDLRSIKDDMEIVKGGIRNKVDQKAFDAITKRFAALEKRIKK